MGQLAADIEVLLCTRCSAAKNLATAVKRLHETAVFQFFHKTVVDQLIDIHFLRFRSAHGGFGRPEGACCDPTFSGETRKIYSRDRKSTRLNSSHLVISYAVFCLKKKK